MEKRLTKSNDRKLAGVCGGIAEYFGFDPTMVRLAWVLSMILAGFGFWAYIILWIVMPNKPQ